VRVSEVTAHSSRDGVRLAAHVERDFSGESLDVYFDYQVTDREYVHASAESLAAALLLPAMRTGEPLTVIPEMSPRLCFNLPRIRDIFHTWWPECAPVPIDARASKCASKPLAPRAATFFSAGVDSFYTLLKHRAGFGSSAISLTHILYIRGVERRLEWTKGVSETESLIREVAVAAGVETIVGETNVRTRLQGPHLAWGRHYNGSALAAIALGLSNGFDYICIPSSYPYNHLIPYGSTPLVDEMFSTERLQIVHDGSEVSRPTKVARIVEWNRDLVLRHLRVCVKNSGGAFNCGKCYKCIRTAVALRVLGLWDQAQTFPNKGTDHWERAIAADDGMLAKENLEFALEHSADRALIAMLRRGLRQRRHKDKLAAILDKPSMQRFRPLAKRLCGDLKGRC
jgi:hypothetical protein